MTAVALTIFNGCQQEDLNIDQKVDKVQPQKAVKPDVYVENGHLAFKDFETYDSTSNLLNKGNEELIEEFEKNLGFKSAYTYRKELSNILNNSNVEQNESLITKISKLGYFNEQTGCLHYPFHNESRATVLNQEGKVKIGKVVYHFIGKQQKMMIQDNLDGIKNFTKTINLEEEVSILKSQTLLWETLASDGGQQRLSIRLFEENEALYDYIIYNGQVVWGIIGYHWTVNIRFHSYRQRLLSSPDRETYFHWIAYRLNIGGNEGYYHHQYYPTNPFTDTSPWKAIYYLKLYDSGLTSNINPPAIYEINMDCWSDRVPNITNIDFP